MNGRERLILWITFTKGQVINCKCCILGQTHLKLEYGNVNPYTLHICNCVLHFDSSHFFWCCPTSSMLCVIPPITLITCFPFPRETVRKSSRKLEQNPTSLKYQCGAGVGSCRTSSNHCPGSSLSLRKREETREVCLS